MDCSKTEVGHYFTFTKMAVNNFNYKHSKDLSILHMLIKFIHDKYFSIFLTVNFVW